MEKHILSEKVILLGSDIYGKECSCGEIHPLDPKNLEPNITLGFCTTCKGVKTLEGAQIELHTLPSCKC